MCGYTGNRRPLTFCAGHRQPVFLLPLPPGRGTWHPQSVAVGGSLGQHRGQRWRVQRLPQLQGQTASRRTPASIPSLAPVTRPRPTEGPGPCCHQRWWPCPPSQPSHLPARGCQDGITVTSDGAADRGHRISSENTAKSPSAKVAAPLLSIGQRARRAGQGITRGRPGTGKGRVLTSPVAPPAPRQVCDPRPPCESRTDAPVPGPRSLNSDPWKHDTTRRGASRGSQLPRVRSPRSWRQLRLQGPGRLGAQAARVYSPFPWKPHDSPPDSPPEASASRRTCISLRCPREMSLPWVKLGARTPPCHHFKVFLVNPSFWQLTTQLPSFTHLLEVPPENTVP